MKPTATLEDYQNREKFLIKYIENQIKNLEKLVWMENMDEGKRKAYKDILFKLMKDEDNKA